MIIYAPWTDEQVAALNRWQNSDYVHPFTCEVHSNRPLLACKSGWVCDDRDCMYTQNWAHDFMLEPPPIPPWERNQK